MLLGCDILSAECMTFGELLSNIIKSKNISVTRLAELTGMKSRNSIQRILKDESSINVIEAFKAKFMELDTLRLSTSELEQLEESIEVTKIGKNTLCARNILLQVFDNRKHSLNFESPILLDPREQKYISLKEFFDTYKAFSKITMLIFDSISAQFTNELFNLIRTSSQTLIYISQIIYFENNRSHNAATFASIFRLFNYENYDVYNISNELTFNKYPNVLSNSIVIDKETLEGNHYTDLIKMDIDNTFSYIMDVPGNSLYSFYLYHFDKLKNYCQNVRKTYEKKNPIDTIIEVCDQCLYLEKNTVEYFVKNNFNFSMIPSNISLKMLIDADYFGLDENDPKIQKLIQINTERFYNYFHTDKMKTSIMTKRGLMDFVKNKVLTDHCFYFRPYTKEEVKAILKYILNQVEDNDFFKLLLLKNDYSIGNIEFVYYENELLWIYDSFSGYDEDYYEALIDATPILDVYDDFIKNELIQNHTLPESETVDFFRYLISIA